MDRRNKSIQRREKSLHFSERIECLGVEKLWAAPQQLCACHFHGSVGVGNVCMQGARYPLQSYLTNKMKPIGISHEKSARATVNLTKWRVYLIAAI